MTDKFTPTHKDVETGNQYMLTGAATVKSRGGPLNHGDVVMIYQAPDGHLYVRARGEFYAGRFETLNPKKG